MPISPRLGPEAAAANMADYKPRYKPQEALLEANRCLFCFDAPCIQACPTGIDVPSFIKKIANGNLTGAARTILNANVLGASCARVCPTQVLCEGACVMLDREGDPVKIGRLQRYATDHVFEKNISVLQPAATKKTGKRVAIIGSGPAGLGCAAELARLGHSPVVFEKTAKAGGLNTYGIAYYKMPPKVSLEEVEMIRGLGVEFRCGVEVGKDITTTELEKEFDAIFVGIGLSGSPKLNVPGENLPEVVEALHFIAQIRMQPLHQVPVGERVAVIGGGNTAIDAVTQARRLGARDAVIVYRRTQPDMSAYDFEQELAKVDGARFLFNVVPVEIVSTGGHVSGLKLARTSNVNGKVQILPGTEFVEPFDMVIKAIGEEKQVSLLKALFPKLELDQRGAVVHDPETGRTNLPKVFAGGDCANGGREVVNAVAEGKKAARAIHALFAGEKITGPVQASRLGVKDGAPVGSGFDRPIRVPELEEEYFAQKK